MFQILLKHPSFACFDDKIQRLLDAFTTKAKEWNIINISASTEQILVILKPVTEEYSMTLRRGYFRKGMPF